MVQLFLDLPSLRLLRVLSKDEFEPKGGCGGEVRTKSLTGFSTLCFTILADYRAVGAIATLSLAAAEAIIVNDVGAITTYIIASLKYFLMLHESYIMDTKNSFGALFNAPLKNICCDPH